MKMILKTMVCLAVAFSGTAGAANYSPVSYTHLTLPTNREV